MMYRPSRGLSGDGVRCWRYGLAPGQPIWEVLVHSRRLRRRTPRPPPELGAPSLINSIPAASSAAMTFVRLSITPRTVPLLASMRWIVGSDTPDACESAFCSIPTRARAAFNWAAVSNASLQHKFQNIMLDLQLMFQASKLQAPAYSLVRPPSSSIPQPYGSMSAT